MTFELPTPPDLADPARARQLQHLLDQKTKPQGSLGRLEPLALQLGLVFGSDQPALQAPQLLICAGDHGSISRE